MIVYSKHCMACRHKDLWKIVRDYSRVNKDKIEIRRVTLRQEWADEAESFNMPLPFVVIDGKAKSIGDL